MRITKDTAEELQLDYIPWVISLVLVGFTVIMAGVGINLMLTGEVFGGIMALLAGGGVSVLALALFAERTQFWADRRAGTVVIRRRTVWGRSEVLRPLAEVREAVVETSHSGKGSDTHRPALRLADGETLALRQTYSSGAGARRVASVINDWLGAGRPA